MFSRGGRALTVLSFVAVAWLGMSGRLYHRYLTAIGFGFENHLKVSLAGLDSNLTDSYDNKPFNFTLGQGDTLIWADQRVFIDSRIGLFVGSSDTLDDLPQTDVIALHSRTRHALRFTDNQTQNEEHRSIWRSTFDRFEITHSLPRIAGRKPDYLTYNLLLLNPDFDLTILAPSVAVFYRNDLEDDDYRAYLAEHGLNFIDQAFGTDVANEESIERDVFPQPDSAYVFYLTAGREQLPPTLVLAQHYSQHIEQAAQGSYRIDVRAQLAFCYLAIRNANLALAEDPNSSVAFQLLGRVYFFLSLIEQDFARINGVEYDSDLRLIQSQLAFHQSLIGNPDNLQVAERLLRIAQFRQQPEAMLRTARRFVELLQNPKEDIENKQEIIAQTQTLIETIESQLNPLYEQVTTQLEADADPMQVASQLNSIGCPYTALEILEQYRESIPASSQVDFLEGVAQLESGRVEDAYTTLLKLEPVFSQFALIDGYRYATYATLGHADYPNAINLKQSETEIHQSLRAAQVLLQTTPLSVDPELYSQSRFGSWFTWTTQVQEEIVRNLWIQAIVLIEQGKNSEAAVILKRAIELAPNSNYRPMLFLYHNCVSDEKLNPIPLAERIPITGDMFAEDPEKTEE